MQNCCHKCQSIEGLKSYGVTKEGFVISKEDERKMRTIRFSIAFLAYKIPRIEHHLLLCPKCAKSNNLLKYIWK